MEPNVNVILYLASVFFLTVYSGAFTALEVLSIARQEPAEGEDAPPGFIDRLLEDPIPCGVGLGVARALVVVATSWAAVRLGYELMSAGAALTGLLVAGSLLLPVLLARVAAVRGAEKFLAGTRFIIVPTVYLMKPVGALVAHLARRRWPGMIKMLSFHVIPLREKIEMFGYQNGEAVDEEQIIMSSIKDFGETRVREVMVPRIDVVAVGVAADKAESIDAIMDAGHSRIPLYEDTIDRIVGTVYTKDLLRRMVKGDEFSLREIARDAFYVPESKMIDDLLTEFKQRKQHLAIVVDEYGGTAGIVTLEDVLEELVGDIQDEFDSEEELVRRIDGDTAECNAKVRIDELNEELGIGLPEDLADSLGGLLYHVIGRVPEVGDTGIVEGLVFEVLSVVRQRIDQVRITGLKTVDGDGESRVG